MSSTKRALGASCAFGALLLPGCASTLLDTGPEPCHRSCLISVLDGYLAAVIAHDPSAVEFSEGFRQTDNAVETEPGEGVWTTMTALGTGRRYADPGSGQAGYFGTIEEEGGPVIVSLRLKATGLVVTEAEWIIAREGMAFYNPEAFIANLPPQERAPDSPDIFDSPSAIDIAATYFKGIDAADGAIVQSDPECFRIENGTQTVGRRPDQPEKTDDTPAGDGVATALAAGLSNCSSGFANLANVTEDVIDRRFFYDPEAGVVWGHGVFKRVEGYVTSQGGTLPWLNFTEIFQIEGGKIRGIYAAMNYLPADVMSSGWPGTEE